MTYQFGSIAAVNIYRKDDAPFCKFSSIYPTIAITTFASFMLSWTDPENRLQRQPRSSRHISSQHRAFCACETLLCEEKPAERKEMELVKCRREVGVYHDYY